MCNHYYLCSSLYNVSFFFAYMIVFFFWSNVIMMWADVGFFFFFMFLILEICWVSSICYLVILMTLENILPLFLQWFLFSSQVSEHLSACMLIHFQLPHRPLMLYSFLLNSLFCLSCYIVSFAMSSRLQMFSSAMSKLKLIPFNERFIS